jgi:hypothetical protein
MTTLVKVARLHRIDPIGQRMAWGVLALSWAINMVIFSVVTHPRNGGNTGGLATYFVFQLIIGVLSITRFLPFGLTLGLSRRSYFFGLMAFILSGAALSAVILTTLNLMEGATNGWGERLHFFRIHWLLDGPWYRTFLTDFVLVLAAALVGVLIAVIYERVGLVGVVAALGGMAVVVTVLTVGFSWHHSWHFVGTFIKGLTALSLTGWLAALAAAVGVAGYATIRGASV